MGKHQAFYVYILASRSRVLYIGVTNDLRRRVAQHKRWEVEGFTKRYNVTRLIYYEATPSSRVAVGRERQLKGWTRKRKIALIEAANPEWNDLSEGW